MAKTNFKSVDGYMASQPAAAWRVLQPVRGAIREALPGAEKAISYQIPAYKLHGRAVFNLARRKQHYSAYPATGRVAAAFSDELASYELSKGTIRFPLSQPIPVKLIARIAKFRAQEVTGREKRKPAK